MSDCSPTPTPLPLQPDKVSGQQELFSNPTYFCSLAGKLQYLTPTRPDLQFAVNFVCQKMHVPIVSDYLLLKRVIRYVKGTLTMGINFNKHIDFTLRTYSDNDWAGCKVTRRSRRLLHFPWLKYHLLVFKEAGYCVQKLHRS